MVGSPCLLYTALALWRTWQVKRGGTVSNGSFDLKKIFPFFILFFVLASIITTVSTMAGVNPGVFQPFKALSKYFIILAMAAIGLNTDIVKLVKTGGKPIFMGVCCWIGITSVSYTHLYERTSDLYRAKPR